MNAPLQRTVVAGGTSRALLPSLERVRLRLYLGLMAGDVLCILASFLLAGGLYLGKWPADAAMLEAQLLLPLYLTLALYQEAYSIRALNDRRFSIQRALFALLVSSALLIFVTFYTKSTASFSRMVFTLGLLFAAMSTAALRHLVIAWIRRFLGPTVTNTLLVEAGGPEVSLPHAVRIAAAEQDLTPDLNDPHKLDRIGRCFLNMDRIVISCPMDQRLDWAVVLRAAGVRGELVTDRLDELMPLALTSEPGCRALVVSTGPLGMRARVAKRAFDVIVAGFALAVTWPIMLAAAAAIKLEDRGPVLFVQRRMGQGNRLFNMLKFRSMAVQRSDSDGVRSASLGDDRLTRVGQFLRRTSIDELPQLINVLRGEMSVVGPRPHALGSHAGSKLFWEVDGRYWNRHSLKPGLTGLAQVRGLRGATDAESDLESRLQSDLEYIARWHLLRDLFIVLGTLRVLVHNKAY